MANRRMFSKNIVNTRGFLEMPPSARALYFHLGIEADDDGFIDPYSTMLTTKATEDDLKVLMAKGFVIRFDSGVVVITHWKQHNTIKNDRYTNTQYIDEKDQLVIGLNQRYEIPSSVGSVSEPQVRLGKVRLGEDSIERETTPSLIRKKFNKREDIQESVISELSVKYQVSEEFVEDCWDSAQNWLDAKGQIKRDYKAFLSNWVKREKANVTLKSSNFMKGFNGKRSIDISNIR